MNTVALSLLTLGIAAFGCLCASMKRHASQTGANICDSARRTQLRWAGWSLLAMMLLIAVETAGMGLGLVLAMGVLTLAAMLVISLITYRPQWVIHCAIGSALTGLAMIVSGLIG